MPESTGDEEAGKQSRRSGLHERQKMPRRRTDASAVRDTIISRTALCAEKVCDYLFND
jgi:hypothetical protein